MVWYLKKAASLFFKMEVWGFIKSYVLVDARYLYVIGEKVLLFAQINFRPRCFVLWFTWHIWFWINTWKFPWNLCYKSTSIFCGPFHSFESTNCPIFFKLICCYWVLLAQKQPFSLRDPHTQCKPRDAVSIPRDKSALLFTNVLSHLFL